MRNSRFLSYETIRSPPVSRKPPTLFYSTMGGTYVFLPIKFLSLLLKRIYIVLLLLHFLKFSVHKVMFLFS
ncbi:hypothetical protein BN3660_03116 [Eubacteriaceae bacterium CHKCI004]|nr:hypothetical protein BN3660_03116 [Eubacteriaceae bacterium CHKCI004]